MFSTITLDGFIMVAGNQGMMMFRTDGVSELTGNFTRLGTVGEHPKEKPNR